MLRHSWLRSCPKAVPQRKSHKNIERCSRNLRFWAQQRHTAAVATGTATRFQNDPPSAPVRVGVQTIHKSGFDGPMLQELYTLATELVHEDYDHFCDHCLTNDICHVFSLEEGVGVAGEKHSMGTLPEPVISQKRTETASEQDRRFTRQLCGFQFWRFQPTCEVANVSLIWGGKLRFRPAYRRRGLHFLANVMAQEHFATLVRRESEVDQHRGLRKMYRVGLVNLFAYNSLASALHSVRIFPFTQTGDPGGKQMYRSVVPEISRFCAEQGFVFDKTTGTVDVGQTFPVDVLKSLEQTGFLKRTVLQEFLQVNQRWQDRDIFIAWKWDEENLGAMRRAAEQQARRTSTEMAILDFGV